MPKVVLTCNDRVIGTRILPKDKPLVLGRGKDVDLLVPNLSVSRRHAKVYFRKGKWYLEDIGSTNGTFFGGERITVCILTHGKTVQLARVAMLFDGEDKDSHAQETGGAVGAYKMSIDEIFRDDKETGPIPTILPMDREADTIYIKLPQHLQKPVLPAGPVPHFEYAGEVPPKRVDLTGDRVTIGKGDGDDVKVKGLLVSRGHARVERRPDGRFWLVPLKWFPAVTVNGLKVTEHCLAFDDYIDIGSTRLWFRKGK